MEEHYHDPAHVRAREELTEAVKKYSQAICEEPQLVMGATVVWETSRYDDDGCQMYTMHHVVLDPGSLVHAIGLLSTARDRLSEFVNRTDD